MSYRYRRNGGSGLGLVHELLRLLNGSLGASADDQSVGVSVRRCEVEDGCVAAYEASRQCAVSCVQSGAEAERALAPVERREEPDGVAVDGARFEDGILTELPVSAEEAVAA